MERARIGGLEIFGIILAIALIGLAIRPYIASHFGGRDDGAVEVIATDTYHQESSALRVHLDEGSVPVGVSYVAELEEPLGTRDRIWWTTNKPSIVVASNGPMRLGEHESFPATLSVGLRWVANGTATICAEVHRAEVGRLGHVSISQDCVTVTR